MFRPIYGWTNAGSMLAQRFRWWAIIRLALSTSCACLAAVTLEAERQVCREAGITALSLPPLIYTAALHSVMQYTTYILAKLFIFKNINFRNIKNRFSAFVMGGNANWYNLYISGVKYDRKRLYCFLIKVMTISWPIKRRPTRSFELLIHAVKTHARIAT